MKKRMAAWMLAAGVAALGSGVALAGDRHDPWGHDLWGHQDPWGQQGSWDRENGWGRDGAFAFAFIGDGPYGAAAEPLWDHTIREINRDREVRFVMHAGDVKAGGERCDDDLLERRFLQYQTLRPAFVYTPGDNEWTDCHRTSNGAYHPLERLAFLRSLFFADPHRSTGGHPIRVRPQSDDAGYEDFVENVMFERGGVVFATVHVVGSNNDLAPWNGIGNTGVTPEQQPSSTPARPPTWPGSTGSSTGPRPTPPPGCS